MQARSRLRGTNLGAWAEGQGPRGRRPGRGGTRGLAPRHSPGWATDQEAAPQLHARHQDHLQQQAAEHRLRSAGTWECRARPSTRAAALRLMSTATGQ